MKKKQSAVERKKGCEKQKEDREVGGSSVVQ